jgi:hypothetical protein
MLHGFACSTSYSFLLVPTRSYSFLLVPTRSYSFLLKDAWLRGFRGLGFTSLFHICGSLLHLWSSGSQVGATSARLRQGNP